ncbi:hypothetical protein [Emticicia sp. SJ17W-69]|uniref:hypothetical protein n=1 Tax=Emticicia sp. SJ17W-69 TaxID=3421657 RepID=UPI003EB75BB6
MKYPYKPLNPIIEVEKVRMVVAADISSMKVAAITNRGIKRDFIYLFFLLKQFSLKQIIDWYQQKYDTEIFMLLQSLVYFDDADGDIDLNMIEPLDWEMIKKEIAKEVKKYLKES